MGWTVIHKGRALFSKAEFWWTKGGCVWVSAILRGGVCVGCV